MSLKDRAKSLNGGKGISFMEGRDKGDVKSIIGTEVTVKDYGFINGDDGEFIVFMIDEDEKQFFFGNKVMTEKFKEFTAAEKAEILVEGLPIRITEQKNKKGDRTYQNVEFYPEDELVF